MIIIAGSNSITLANQIAAKISAPCIYPQVKRFEDQELSIEIEASLNKKKVIIVQSTSKPANDHLMELLLLIDAAKRAGARKIIAIIPYFGYARQDRKSQKNAPISASLVANLLETAGISKMITVDLHSQQIEGFFNISVDNIIPQKLFLPLFSNNNLAIASPDLGGIIRAQKFSTALNCNLAIINKTRNSNGECIIHDLMGEVKNKHCILVDDIIDTGKTLCQASELVMAKGAISVKACITHAVLSGNAIELVENSKISEIFITNTIAQQNLSSKFKTISIANIIVDSLNQ